MQRRARLGPAVLTVVLGIAGCGSVNTSAESPKPAGKSPSAICQGGSRGDRPGSGSQGLSDRSDLG
jgi:hypothetical protein